jgi:hypothetical protein
MRHGGGAMSDLRRRKRRLAAYDAVEKIAMLSIETSPQMDLLGTDLGS